MSVDTAPLLFIGIIFAARNLLKKQCDKKSSSPRPQNRQLRALSLPLPEKTLNLIKNRRSIFTKQFTGDQVRRAVVEDMLEAAQWAPTHHITEPWRFFVYESQIGREGVGHLLQSLYKNSCVADGEEVTSEKKSFSQAKFDKKLKGALLSSHIIAICVKTKTKNPIVEEICSVAMAVQNMHLIATAHGVGAYWSSAGVHSTSSDHLPISGVVNPQELTDFLQYRDGEPLICLGWLYIGDYLGGASHKKRKAWPSGRRTGIEDKVVWR